MLICCPFVCVCVCVSTVCGLGLVLLAVLLGAPLASLLQVVLVQPLGLLALQQGVRLERLKRVDSGDSGAALVAAAPLLLEHRPGVRLVPLQPEALVRRGLVPLRLCRSFSPWAQPEALLEDKEKRRPCPRRSSAGRLRWHWT